MMNQAVEGLEVVQPGVRENISYLKAREQRQFEAQQKAAAQAAKFQMDDMGSMSLKEVIELHAQHNNLLFKPKPGRMQDGHQVYGIYSVREKKGSWWLSCRFARDYSFIMMVSNYSCLESVCAFGKQMETRISNDIFFSSFENFRVPVIFPSQLCEKWLFDMYKLKVTAISE
ncbi:septin and tuftelin-interacting protein 1 [Artemisia annua]|uniref:Septin and tuftelin-interacting protein 1 n=1 Tax=Artemisia annua TaxID=35608 RepID=A0A2U1QHR8_ARTAN|nr:septin and tuftelin-interacting protein 1 [Artemisia annua]